MNFGLISFQFDWCGEIIFFADFLVIDVKKMLFMHFE
jgi:hypothetical protein